MNEQLKAGFKVIQAVAEAIRAAKKIPSGHLYAALMGKLTLDQYQSIINTLKGTGLVTESFHELTWVEPKEQN